MEGDLLSLKWNNHKATFLHVLENLRSKASYADATLACNEQFFPVHKLVLSTCSDYFSAVFEQTSCKNPVIILKDIECKNLIYLLDYMYLGEVNVKQNELASLVGTAECLRIKGLAVPDEDVISKPSSLNKRQSFGYFENFNPPTKKKKNNRNDLKIANNSEKVEVETPVNLSETCFENTLFVDSYSNPIKCEPPSDEEIVEDDPISDSDNSLPLNIDNNESESNGSKLSEPEFITGDTEELFAKDEPVDPSSEVLNKPGPSSIYDNDLSHRNLNTSSPKCQEEDAVVDIMSTSGSVSGLGSSLDFAYNLEHLPSGNSTDLPISPLTNNLATEKSSIKAFSNLSISIVDEDGVRLYKCNICTYVTPVKTNAKQHSMIHSGIKPYYCPYCPYKALRKEHLSKHLFVHTGERPFRCPYCHYRAITKQVIQLHVFRKHKHNICSNIN